MTTYFYDIHTHAYDLSHADLSAIAQRFLFKTELEEADNENFMQFNASKKLVNDDQPSTVWEWFLRKLTKKLRNTLAVLEYPIEDHFLILEYYLKNVPEKLQGLKPERYKELSTREIQELKPEDIGSPVIITKDNKIEILGFEEPFDKLVMCPLMMDFGVKGTLDHGGLYSAMPGKPIVKQTRDLFNAIKNYYSFVIENVGTDEKPKLIKVPIPPTQASNKPFRILPFLGINPANYETGDTTVDSILKQYFNGYENDDTQQKRFERVEKSVEAYLSYDGNFPVSGKEYPNMFFGVKVYPPLGFEPSAPGSLALMKKCNEYKLPVTTHCSDSGYNVDKNSIARTHPDTWKKAFTGANLQGLRFNYAHFGASKHHIRRGEHKHTWRDKIKNQMTIGDNFPTIYSDISSLANEQHFYNKTIEDWHLEDKHIERLLFGSDFVINLLECDSYNQYLGMLATCTDLGLKQKICVDNPTKFLFGS